MGFTVKLLFAYLVLSVLDAIALAHGFRRKKWVPFALITGIMAAGVAVAGYLWIASPM